ncbi:MAG: hypothetical protein QIT35_gp70 [Methanophagales virus PBV299]|uniref:Uncharacterized protein n=1 Tax=Methanophagales virus PBV299 TaxID=2987730 RepID=A0ABY6GLI5_9CAUD|nr:MAG: hypothetical protein QIT35_gp70 [Methanophagales virus PBV299]UYL64866.1 MAG: hypothetical protein OFDIEDLO_00070 [Methanophagales virus PBV299]
MTSLSELTEKAEAKRRKLLSAINLTPDDIAELSAAYNEYKDEVAEYREEFKRKCLQAYIRRQERIKKVKEKVDKAKINKYPEVYKRIIPEHLFELLL